MKRWRPTHWFLLSLACFLGAFIVWKLNNSGQAGKPPATDSPAPGQPAPAASPAGALRPVQESVTAASTAPLMFLGDSATNTTASAAPSPHDLLQKYRLRNTSRTVGELSRSDRAILLANALIDSSQALNLSIPNSLRATGDPGAYIVQAQGLIDDAFRARLKGAGASVVSYIPNNAYLVRASADVAKQLASLPGMQAVLPFEPYYKIPNFKLLAVAVEGQLLPPETTLNVLAFPGTEQTIEGALRPIGEIVGRDRSPFGPVFKVQARANSLTALARLPEVQTIEVATPRRRANDFSRVRVGVAVDTQTNVNYLNLSGSNVIVYVNDSGVDQQHPDLAGRVFSTDPASLEDTNGHGTHVVGIIGSSGSVSDTVNAIGSIKPGVTGQYRGKAPAANIFMLSLDSFSDLELQEAAALTNALIDNNSWNYGSHDYDIAAANFDAGVRDSLTGTNGSQAVVYVFSAGNDGNGTSDGVGITEGSIQSPATSKNVISVGAIEQPRGITNEVMTVDGGVTNISTPWIRPTDSDNQVAGFSSRGNVGVDIEGDFGRFKPDVVAPGTFVVSTTTHARWNTSRYYNNTNYLTTTFIDTVEPGTIQPYPVFLPFNTVELFIGVFAIEPILDLPIYVDPNRFPTINDFPVATNSVFYSGPTDLEQFWFYAIGNPTNRLVRFQVTTVRSITNNVGNYFQVLSNMNNDLGPYYRYESGTSMAAADVSGVLALIGDYFTNSITAHLRPSPALMKAMLINGARSVNAGYDLQVRKTINDQGWGLINLTNSLPTGVTNGFGALNHVGAMVFYDQDPTNSLLTGDSRTLNVKVDPAANGQPLRFSMVWTDPPGNPAAGIKLVNDLDLIVTNLDDPREVYFGNDIAVGRNFNLPMATNSPPKIDNINNVENIFIASPLTGTNYSVTVKAHRVNVNAVTAHTNGIAQDYALVISSGDGSVSNAISVAAVPNITPFTALNITTITNEFGTNANVSGQTLTGQHVGANSPLLGLDRVPLGTNTMWGQPGTNGTITLGEANQWHFYVVTNGTSFTNATFRLGLPLNLALSRMGVTNYTMLKEAARVEADIDLYVSTESNLLTLDPAAVENARKSVGRGGIERIILNDAVPGQVYYVGVKAEDQQASEYRFTVLFTLLPPGQKDGNGFQVCYAVPEIIPDGTPDHPGGTRNLAIDWDTPGPIRRVVVQDTVEHENFGDLLGTLVRNGQTLVTLNNHTCMTDPGGVCFTNFHYVYEDNGENDFNGLNGLPASQHTDGPGSLQDYIGMDGAATWELTMVDNQFGSSGRVVDFRILVETIQNSTNFVLVKQPGSFAYAPVDVPPEATNMTICVSGVILPEQLFVRRAGLPTLTNFDYTIALTPPGGCLTIDKFDLPPLRTGRYFIGIYNPNPVTLTNIVSITFGLRLDAVPTIDYTSGGPAPIVDDAVTYSSIFVTNDQAIVRLEVGVALAHPRPSDLALTLISPSGKRILLSENREGLINTGLSAACGSPDTNSGWVQWDVPSGGNGHWYKAVATNNVTWSQADTIAHNECGYLATITSASENAFVFSLINNGSFFSGIGNNGSGPAIGGVQPNGSPEPAGGWTWETGEPWVYTSWAPGQPDDCCSANVESRAEFWSGTQGVPAPTWNDLNPDDPNLGGYVIERDNPVLNYTVFTENTNFAQLPIKFQPFGNVSGATNQIVIGDFDGAAPGTYVAPTNVVGWDVLNNQVSVVNDPLNAHPGHVHYLALGGGLLSRTLNVVPGTRYVVNYSYRGPGIVGWWRGEPGVAAVDYVAGNNGSLESVDFMNGEVDQAFSFLSPDPLRKISIPDRPVFALTNALSIEGWVNIAGPGGRTIFWRGDTRGGFDPYFLQVNDNNIFEFVLQDQTGTAAILDAGAVPYGQWCHVAATWDGNTGNMMIYTNGFLSTVLNTAIRPFGTLDTNLEPTLGIGNIGTHIPFTIPFFGGIDEMSLYARALSPTEVLAIYNTGTTGKFDRAVSAPLNLAKAQVALGGIGGDTFFGDNNIWRNRTLAFTPAVQAITLQVIGLEPGMLLDSLTLAELPINNYAKPEETLESVYGDNAHGTWRLEIWDNRAGVPVTALINWQLKFIFEDNTPAITPLFNGIPVTNSVPACQIAYFSVDVPTWVNYVTNRLLFATGPVNVWFNQGIPPTTTNAADILLIGNSMGGSSTISTDLINYPPPLPPLLPGQRYYLAVENPCANGSNVTFAIEVDFGAGFIRLTNMVPYFNTSAGSNSVNDYYVYGVSATAARAQFEINFPTDDMTLVARRGLPPPFLFGFDYMSSNPGSNDELIVVFTNSIPTPLGPGDWYLTAINVSGGPVSYSIMASEWPVTGRPFSITNAVATTNSFCFTWTALPLVHYYVQGLTALTNNNWITLSHTITAVTNEATFCVALPSDYHFFRVVEGLALEDVAQPPPFVTGTIQTNGILLQWPGSVTTHYQVQWTPAISPAPVIWNNFTNVLTTTSGSYSFLDDGSQTGGIIGVTRFYRIRQLTVP